MIEQKNKQAIVQSAVEKYYDDIYRFCRYYTGNEVDSYDIVQEVFLRFLKYSDSCGHRNLKGYLFMIARNLCCDYFRNLSIQRENMFSLDAATENAVDGTLKIRTGYSRTIEDCDSELFLRELLQSIPQEQREVVLLRIHDGLKFREIAKIAGCSLSTAKSRFRLGIAGIKKKMEVENGGYYGRKT
ncbi:MAG: RNA polymerase sigma factor [Lachnospiraceae bacterium]|nr:RNA polymerase sigma factor [Lachnospiraceae bacterium]